MHRLPSTLVLSLLATAALAWALPAPAHACSCSSGVSLAAPAPGGVLPANGLLVLHAFCGGDPDALEVLVDGMPASLVPEGERMAGLGHRIVPAPALGATVQLTGCGAAECLDEPLDVSLTVISADDEPPPAPVLGELGYVVEQAYEDECSGETTKPARDWTVTIDGNAIEPLVYVLTLQGGGGPAQVTHAVALDGGEVLERTIRRFEEDAGSSVCMTVQAFDLAGNAAPEVSTCEELERRDTLDGDGCACSSGGARGWPGALLLGLVGAWSRRRRG